MTKNTATGKTCWIKEFFLEKKFVRNFTWIRSTELNGIQIFEWNVSKMPISGGIKKVRLRRKIANRRETRSCFGQVFNLRLGSFVSKQFNFIFDIKG
jgi:hypothetical protein